MAKSGQITSAVTSVIGDHAVTLTVAVLPLALAGLPVNDLQLFVTVLCFVGLVAILYTFFIYWGKKKDQSGFRLWQVIVLGLMVLVYISVILFWVLNVFK